MLDDSTPDHTGTTSSTQKGRSQQHRMSGPLLFCWRSLFLLSLLGGQICLITNHRAAAAAAAATQQKSWQLGAEEEPAIVINSRHSAKAAPAQLVQERRDNRQRQQPVTRVSSSSYSASSGQPSQEFDFINNLVQLSATSGPNKLASSNQASATTRRQSASSLIRDTSELLAAGNQYELEQRRVADRPTTTTTTTTESWMQSVRDNHHGPIRSRFNLVHHQSALVAQAPDRFGLAGKRVIPIGDNNQLVLDGHMKPGVSQPVPYEQQNLIKSVRTAEQPTITTPASHRRNSKFTRRSTEYLDDSPPSTSEPSTTTPSYQAKMASSRAGTEFSWRDKTTENKTSKADFKTILVSNNHRPMSGAKPKERRPAAEAVAEQKTRSSRSLTDRANDATDSANMKAESRQQQQPKGWSRLFRTLGTVIRRLTNGTTTTTTTVPPSVVHGFAAMQSQQFNSFATPPPVALPTTNFQQQQQPSLGVVNYIASALSAALSAVANRPLASKHNTVFDDDHRLHPAAPVLDDQLFGGNSNPIGANSMRHETREPGLRQHANKKIIDSLVDLPVSERRTGTKSTIEKRNGLVASNSSRKARTIAAADQDFELEPAGSDVDKGNGSWSIDAASELSADFYLGANLTDHESASQEAETTTTAEALEPEEGDQLDFRTTTDATAASEDGSDLSEAGAPDESTEDEGEQLEAADSIIVPERLAHEVAHDLGEPAHSHRQQQGQHQQDDAVVVEDEEEENLFAPSEDLAEGFSLFYAPAPSELLHQAKHYRKESTGNNFDSTDETGEGSFARITPVSNHHRLHHSSTRNKNTNRRPQPAPFHSSDTEEEARDEDENPMRGGMTFMMIPSRMRPDRRRPSTSSRRRPASSAQLAVPAISLKDTRRPVANAAAGSRNRNKPATSSKPPPAGAVFNWPKIQNQPNTGQDKLSPMSSSISVMDLDPSMTRLAHNKLIVAKFRPKFKQQPPPKKSNQQNQNLLHRSSGLTSEPVVRKQQPLSLSSALLASSSDNANNLNELVSRRWQMKPRSTSTTTTEAADLLARDQSGESSTSSTTTTTTSTARSIQEQQDNSLPRIASDFQFLMPGLASGLAARISSLTRPHTSTPASTSAPPANPNQASPPSYEPSRETSPSSYTGETSSQPSQSYGGNRNDKFNFSLMQMNNRERINPLLYPVERFSNSSSYSVQQQQREQQKNKPANHRSRVTTSTMRPTTTSASTTTTTTTTTTPVTRQQMNVTSSDLPTTPSRLRTSQRPRSTTTTVRPIRTTTTQKTTTTTIDNADADDDSTIGQIVRNQHHHTTSYTRHATRPNRPLTESERLRNQYLAMIGKNASLDGRIWQTESPPSPMETTVSTGSPLGHMSLVEAAHDANKYTTLDAGSAANDDDPALGIVILSDNHHNRRPSSPAVGTRRNGASAQAATRLPPFNAGHTKYELASKPGLQPDTARKYLEEFVNGTRIRPSSMSKLVTATNSNNTASSTSSRRNQPTAFNSVQGSPPSPMLDGQPLMGKLDLRAQELLLGAVFDGDNLNQPSRSFLQQQNSTPVSDMDRIKTQSTITLTPVPPPPASSTTSAPTASEESTTQAQTPAAEEPERGLLDLGESGDLNNRASMRKNQAKIQSILSALAYRNKTTTQAPIVANSDSDESGEQDFKTTTLADYSPASSSSTEEDLAETTRFYAPIKLTTRSSYFRPPMSTPAPGRGGAYPNIETSGSRQKINRPALVAGNDSSANFEYSPTMPSSAAPPRNSEMPTTKLTESLASDQLKQTIRDRIGGGGSIHSAVSEYSPTSTTLAMDAENGGQTETSTAASFTDESTPAELTVTTEPMAESTHAGDGEESTNEISNRRRPTTEADYPEMPTFPQTRPPPRPVIIRRRPTKRPPPQHLTIGQSGEDVVAATSKPRRRKKPAKRPTTHQVGDAESDGNSSSQKRKIIYRPVQVTTGESSADSPVLIRKRPGGYIRPPDNIHIHPAPAMSGELPVRIRNSTYRPASVTAPVSIMLPSSMETLHLKKKDHDIRTRPLTIIDPPSSSSGDHLTDENILSPAILTRIPETTIMHDKMLVSYKPGRPLPGSMSSFGTMGHPKPHNQHDRQPTVADSGADSTSSLVDSLINSITTSVAPSPSNSSYTARPPQLGSGNGGDTHLISIEQQQRERQTTRLPPQTQTQTQTPSPLSSTTTSSLSDSPASSNASQSSNYSSTATAHRPIIVINGNLFGNDDHHQQQKPNTNNNEQQHHSKRPSASLGSNSLLEAGSLSVVAQASHGQANSSRPWYPTAAVSGWPSKHNSSSGGSQGQGHSFDSSAANSSSSLSDLSSSSSTSIEQSVFGGSEMPNFGSPSSSSSSQPSGSYQNHQLQNQQQPIGMPYQVTSGAGGSRPGQRPQANRPWRVRRRPSGNASPTGSGSGSSNAGYNFNSASSVSNYVYRPLMSSVSSFGVLFDNVQIFFARVRTFIISLMVMFLPPLALAFSVVQAMSA